MTEQEYSSDFDIQSEINRMTLCLDLLSNIDLKAIIAVVRDAHNVGWFIDPTAYRDALYRGDMDRIAKLAAALVEPMELFKEIREKATNHG